MVNPINGLAIGLSMANDAACREMEAKTRATQSRLDKEEAERRVKRAEAAINRMNEIESREGDSIELENALSLVNMQKAIVEVKNKEISQKDLEIQNKEDVIKFQRGQLKEKDDLILEWMHTNEAFKRLAKIYGKRLDLSSDDIQKDLDVEIQDLSEEDSNFKNTEVKKRSDKRLLK